MPICFHGALEDVSEQAVDLSQSHLFGEFIPQRTVSFSYSFLIDDWLSSHRGQEPWSKCCLWGFCWSILLVTLTHVENHNHTPTIGFKVQPLKAFLDQCKQVKQLLPAAGSSKCMRANIWDKVFIWVTLMIQCLYIHYWARISRGLSHLHTNQVSADLLKLLPNREVIWQ